NANAFTTPPDAFGRTAHIGSISGTGTRGPDLPETPERPANPGPTGPPSAPTAQGLPATQDPPTTEFRWPGGQPPPPVEASAEQTQQFGAIQPVTNPDPPDADYGETRPAQHDQLGSE